MSNIKKAYQELRSKRINAILKVCNESLISDDYQQALGYARGLAEALNILDQYGFNRYKEGK